MRVHFELKYGADNLDQARSTAYQEVAKFMGVNETAAPALVDVELRVSNPDPEKDSEIAQRYVVTAYGNVKHSIATPF